MKHFSKIRMALLYPGFISCALSAQPQTTASVNQNLNDSIRVNPTGVPVYSDDAEGYQNYHRVKTESTFNAVPDALSMEEESAPLPVVQFFPKRWSELLPVFHSSPDLLMALTGILITGLLGTILSIRTQKD